MLNKIQDGNKIDVVLAAVANPGDVYAAGDLIGVIDSGGKIGDTVMVAYTGVYALPKATGAGSGIAQSTKVYYDATAKVITATAGSNVVAGHVWKTAADADTTVNVRLLG